MLVLLHRQTRRRRKMTRQARKLSVLGTYQGVWYQCPSAVTADGPLFWSNKIVVAYEKMIRRTDPWSEKGIDRIDNPKDGQIHAHQKGKGATNADGTIHDKGKGVPKWSNKITEWLRNYGFNI